MYCVPNESSCIWTLVGSRNKDDSMSTNYGGGGISRIRSDLILEIFTVRCGRRPYVEGTADTINCVPPGVYDKKVTLSGKVAHAAVRAAALNEERLRKA